MQLTAETEKLTTNYRQPWRFPAVLTPKFDYYAELLS